MLYLPFKSSNAATNEIKKLNPANVGNNVNYLIVYMVSNYATIIDKGGHHEYFVCRLLRVLLSGTNSTFNCIIERTKDNWDTLFKILASELIRDATEKYSNMIAAKQWTSTDLKDDKILALLTRLYRLKKKICP